MALSFGQSLHLAHNRFHALSFVQHLVGGNCASGQILRKVCVQLLRPNASPPVDGKVPCNANQPYTQVPYF